MGLRFRKSIKIAPGVKINLNKKALVSPLVVRSSITQPVQLGKKTASVGIPVQEFLIPKQLVNQISKRKLPKEDLNLCLQHLKQIFKILIIKNGIKKQVGLLHY